MTQLAHGFAAARPATATVAFDDLVQTYDGTARLATATIDPVGVAGLSLAYAPTSPPVAVGSYTVTATLSNPNYVLSGPVMTLWGLRQKRSARAHRGSASREP